MPSPAIDRFLCQLESAGMPYVTTKTQVVCGRVAITVRPDLDSPFAKSLRLDLPSEIEPKDSVYWVFFLVSLFGSAIAGEVLPRLHAAIHARDQFSESIQGCRLYSFIENGYPALVAEVLQP